MDDPLLVAVRKCDDDAIVTQIDDDTIELITEIDLTAGDDDDDLPPLLNGSLLTKEAHSRPARIPVRVVQHMFATNAVFAAMVMTLSYIVYYALSFDTSNGRVAFFVLIAAICSIIVFYSLLLVVVVLRNVSQSPFLYPLLGAFALSVVIFAGALASLAHNITPLQAGTICFAQSLAVYGYALSSPSGIDPLHAVVYMIIAAMGVWFIGLYGFIVQQAWISSGLLFFFGALTSFYYSAQVQYAHRYSLSHEDTLRATAGFYLDPALLVVAHFKRPVV